VFKFRNLCSASSSEGGDGEAEAERSSERVTARSMAGSWTGWSVLDSCSTANRETGGCRLRPGGDSFRVQSNVRGSPVLARERRPLQVLRAVFELWQKGFSYASTSATVDINNQSFKKWDREVVSQR
jgi:hypothetical protein